MLSYSTMTCEGTFQVRGGVRFIHRSCSLSLFEFPDLCSNSGRYGMHVAKLYHWMVVQPGMNNYLADRGYLKCSAQGSSLRNEPGSRDPLPQTSSDPICPETTRLIWVPYHILGHLILIDEDIDGSVFLPVITCIGLYPMNISLGRRRPEVAND